MLVILGEYEEKYAAVANEKAIPTWPVTSPKRWNILVDAVLFPGRTVYPTTSVDGVPSNKAVALLDSGTSYSYVFSPRVEELTSNLFVCQLRVHRDRSSDIWFN